MGWCAFAGGCLRGRVVNTEVVRNGLIVGCALVGSAAVAGPRDQDCRQAESVEEMTLCLADRLVGLEAELDLTRQQLAETQQLLLERDGEIVSLRRHGERIEAQVDSDNEELRGMQSELATVGVQVAHTASMVEGAYSEVEDLRVDNRFLKADVSGLQSDIGHIGGAVSGMQSELFSVQREQRSLDASVTELRVAITDGLDMLAFMRQEVAEMGAELWGIGDPRFHRLVSLEVQPVDGHEGAVVGGNVGAGYSVPTATVIGGGVIYRPTE